MKYVSYKNANGTERGMTTYEAFHKNPRIHQFYIDGNPMIIVSTFDAESWDAAMQVHYSLNGWGRYVPMKE